MKNSYQLLLLLICTSSVVFGQTKPNLIVIHTDEHNFRTLGCYRNVLTDEEAYMWGQNTVVETPHIDALADRGLLCTGFYATSPVCTPSRASLISGLYPVKTGSPKNDYPLNDDVISYAEILKQNGYATSYVGKWHLDGDAKPGFMPPRNFGFDDNRFMINRGHWKLLQDTLDGIDLIGEWDGEKGKYSYDINEATSTSYTTDFLFDKAIEIIERDKDEAFCLMLSIPDPHGPDVVREPYNTMYSDMHFDTPLSMQKALEERPNWVAGGSNSITSIPQLAFTQYFGMVKCIDDNVGELMSFLGQKGLLENTIVVFTADHGDLMGEHAQKNKGLPYETSACIPFIMAFPGQITPGKVLSKAYTVADFAPTILDLMGINYMDTGFDGENVSADFLNDTPPEDPDRIVYITNAASRWVAAVNNRYKLVLSPSDRPYLFDLETDPHEIVNFYNHPDYEDIADTLKSELIRQMQQYDEPLYETGTIIYDYAPCEKGDNPISNPSFECLLDGWNISDVTIDFNNSTSGSSSARFAKGYIRQTIPVVPNTECTISFDYKYTDLGEGVSNNTFIVFENDTREVEIAKLPISADSLQWTKASVEFNAGENDSIFLQIARWNTTSKGLLNIDNFRFEGETVPSSIHDIPTGTIASKIHYGLNHIRIIAPERIWEASMYDLKGRLLVSKHVDAESVDIETYALNQGVFIVRLGFEGRNEVCKVIKR